MSDHHRYIVFVTGGLVTNWTIAGDDYEIPEGAFDVSSITPYPQIGWSYSSGAWTPPASPPPIVPAIVSRRQFFQQLALQAAPVGSQTIITPAEALAAMAGTIPPELATLIAGLPESEQFAAQMLVSGATQFDRNNAFTAAIGAAYGLSSDQLDALWTAASLL